MTLQEFLLTADADHNTALQQAIDYQPEPYVWRIEGAIRKTQVETALIVNGTRERLDALIVNAETPAPIVDLAKKIKRAVDALYEPEFYINLADLEVSAMIAAAEQYGILNADEINRISAAATYQDPKPFVNTTLFDVLRERGVCPTKPVSATNGYVTVTTTGDCPKHSPRLIALNPRTNRWQRINNFYDVANVGVYDAAVPPQFNGWQLAVDDAYGVM